MIKRLLLLALVLCCFVHSAFAYTQGVSKTIGWASSAGGANQTYGSQNACTLAYGNGLGNDSCSGSGGTAVCSCNDWTGKNYGNVYAVASCPAGRPQEGPDHLCYVTPPVTCPDGSFADSLAQCPAVAPPPCASGMIDGGIDASNHRICTVAVCNAPGVLQPNGSCKMPDGISPAPQGSKGDTGATGATGANGDKGDKGDTGSIGAAGAAGQDGAQGAMGSAGATGATGANGLNGSNGATGATGSTGATGLQGLMGAMGLQGLMGAMGMTGATGASGANGVNGAAGSAGAAGVAGVAGAAGVDGKDGKSFCEANPGLAACHDSSVSGACAETTCNGDAIQCSTLRVAATMACAQAKEADDIKAMASKSLGDQIANGADPQAKEIADNLKGTEVDLSRPNLDTSGFLGGGSCFPAKSFSVAGRSVTMDFTAVCDSITPLRYAVMACASIVAYLIIAKSLMQG